MNTSTEVTLKTIADISIENVKFYIDAFQRGYRWTESEVKDLLSDIYEFSQSDYKSHGSGTADKFYCLQPIIVTQMGNGSWKVIDGQQRLTTLYLVYMYYNAIAGKLMRSPMPFELHYNGKEKLELCLAEIQREQFFESINLQTVLDRYEDDIDCYFIISAYREICDFFGMLGKKLQTQGHVMDMKTVFDNYMKIIWYELIDCNEQEEIAMFTKINMGKIALTNAELIKALLLRTEEGKKTPNQDNIAIKWDEIEAQLYECGFWSFLVNNSSHYTTRIDFIFEIMAKDLNESVFKELSKFDDDNTEQYYIEQVYNRQYFSFYVFNNYVRYLSKSKSNQEWEYV